MSTFIDFVTDLIYKAGAGAPINPNHRDFIQAGGHTGTQWLAHYTDPGANSMLGAFRAWLATNHLPPLIEWDAREDSPYDPADVFNAGHGLPLPAQLDGSFSGVANLEALGQALSSRLDQIVAHGSGSTTYDFGDDIKMPYSVRFWSYLAWADLLVRRFKGETVVPADVMYDRDGTILSALPFLNVVDEVHWRWHDNSGPHGLPFLASGTPAGTANTPGWSSTVGQRVTAINAYDTTQIGAEFFRFHRDHLQMVASWLARTGQVPPRSILMTPSDSFSSTDGWPLAAQMNNNPSTWVQPTVPPWIDTEDGDTSGQLRTAETDLNAMGMNIMNVHAVGHNNNGDIVAGNANNFVYRFFAWHAWVDNQWWWRGPHFGRWGSDGLRAQVFGPVRTDGTPWPGLPALTIVRDPTAAADVVSPANAVQGVDLTSGAGTLRMQFAVHDPYGRLVDATFTAVATDDATSTTVETVTVNKTIGPAGDFALDATFTIDFAFASAFRSDDPTRANPAVGFAASRIRVTGHLDAGDAFTDDEFLDIDLVQEKVAPEIDLYFDLNSFSLDQVTSNGGAPFGGFLTVIVQDQTSEPAPIAWPSTVPDELKGVLRRRVVAAGLFDDRAPLVELLQESVDTVMAGVTITPVATAPEKEDATLADNLPQRFTWRYDIAFATTNDAFAGLTTGMTRNGRIRVTTFDRAGNPAVAIAPVRFFVEENPYMRDGDPFYLSIDTRVMKLYEGDSFASGANLTGGQPLAFIQQVLTDLNDPATAQATRDGWFDNLPQDEDGSALEYSTSVTDHTTSTTRRAYNFALAKVRVQGANGASKVRGFFRVFRYTATNLMFDDTDTGTYRVHDTGAGTKVPLLGFDTSGAVASIPFFATPRVPYSTDMRTQGEDTPNVFDFPSGNPAEQHHYFGVWLDLNQDTSNSRLPASRITAHPDGGFATAEVEPIRSVLIDAHCCLVAEIRYDGDPTALHDAPSASDNLAQRNLAIVQTDNPGAPITHTVEHSFLADLGGGHADQRAFGPIAPMTAARRDRTAHELASVRAFNEPMPAMTKTMSMTRGRTAPRVEERRFAEILKAARAELAAKVPFVFDAVRWQSTVRGVDELQLRWNQLPRASQVELRLPGVSCEQVMNLRALRHAPGDVRIVDSHTLSIVPAGVTYIPLPPTTRWIAGVVTIALPDHVRKGQRWKIDVMQLRGAGRQTTGAFQIDVQVRTADAIVDAEQRLLDVLFTRLARTPVADRWHPILVRRVATTRARLAALAARAGVPWTDPSTWTDPKGGHHPVLGPRVRVVLECVELDDTHPHHAKGHLRLRTRVRTDDNGGIEQRHAFGPLAFAVKHGKARLDLDRVIFDGFAADELAIEVAAAHADRDDEDDPRPPRYRRVFCCPAAEWFGDYSPNDEPIDPEELGSWRLWYRIERG